MTIWSGGGRPRRAPAIGKTLILDTWLGIQRARIWPRARPRRPAAPQRARQSRLIDVTAVINLLIPREQIPMREAIARYNQTVRGQAGSAAVRYEDWQTSRLYGSSWALRLPDGTIVWSQAQRQRVSDWLDWICDEPGAVLERGPYSWTAALECGQGYKFTSTAIPEVLQSCPLCE